MVLDIFIDKEENSQIPIVHVKGEIDIYTSPKLKQTLDEAIENGNRNLILDFTGVSYLDSTGLALIVSNANTLTNLEGKLHIRNLKSAVKKIFEVSGIVERNLIAFDQQ